MVTAARNRQVEMLQLAKDSTAHVQKTIGYASLQTELVLGTVLSQVANQGRYWARTMRGQWRAGAETDIRSGTSPTK